MRKLLLLFLFSVVSCFSQVTTGVNLLNLTPQAIPTAPSTGVILFSKMGSLYQIDSLGNVTKLDSTWEAGGGVGTYRPVFTSANVSSSFQPVFYDTLRLQAGTNVSFVQNNATKTITITAAGTGGGADSAVFSTIYRSDSLYLTYLDSTELKKSLLKNADSTTLKTNILSQVLKNADSTSIRNRSNQLYLKNADSTTLKTNILSQVLKNADSTTLKNGLLKNADSTSIRNRSTQLYAPKIQPTFTTDITTPSVILSTGASTTTLTGDGEGKLQIGYDIALTDKDTANFAKLTTANTYTTRQTLSNTATTGTGTNLYFNQTIKPSAALDAFYIKGIGTATSGDGAAGFYRMHIVTADSTTDYGSGLAIHNTGRADNLYLGVNGIAGGATLNNPCGIGLDLNRSLADGVSEQSSTFSGYGLLGYDWTQTNSATPASLISLRKINSMASTNNLIKLQANKNALIVTTQGLAYGYSATNTLMGVSDTSGTGYFWEMRNNGQQYNKNGILTVYNMASGNSGFLGSSADNWLYMRIGSAGFRLQNNGATRYNLSVTDTGNVGIWTSSPTHRLTALTSSANLNAFNFTNSTINTVNTTAAQGTDTSSIYGNFTGTGSPILGVVNKTGSTIFKVDSATTTASNMSIGSLSGSLLATNGVVSASSGAGALDPTQFFTLYEDFLSQGITAAGSVTQYGGSNTGWIIQTLGSGSRIFSGTPSQSRIGIDSLNTGTQTQGASNVAHHLGTDVLTAGGGSITYKTTVMIPTLSTPTENFIVRLGFQDNWSRATGSGADGGIGASADGIYFEYCDTINGGQWTCVTSSNSVRTKYNLANSTVGSVDAGTWYTLSIDVNTDGSSVTFTVKDQTTGVSSSPAGATTTNIPTNNGRWIGIGHQITKKAGTTPRAMNVDYAWLTKTFTTAR